MLSSVKINESPDRKGGSRPEYSVAADFNADGSNDFADLLLLIGNYNMEGDL